MDASHKQIIISNLSILVEKTDLSSLVPELYRRKVFNQEMLNRILSQSHNDKHRKTELYLDILKRGPDAFSKLKSALLATKHFHLVQILEGNQMEDQQSPEVCESNSINSVGSDLNECSPSLFLTQGEDIPGASNRFYSLVLTNGSQSNTDIVEENFHFSKDLNDGCKGYCQNKEIVKISHFPEYTESHMSEILKNVFTMTPDDSLLYTNEKFLPVKVKLARDWAVSKPGQPQVYKMDSFPRGHALVIHNYIFSNKKDFPDRIGSDNDEIRLTALLTQLHYEIDIHKNKTKGEMEDIVKNFCRKKELKIVDSVIVVFMSHGGEGDSEEDSEIIGVDGIGLKTKDIVGYFFNDYCYFLINKPKIFFFGACRGCLEDPGVLLGSISLGNRITTDGKKITQQYKVKIRTQSDLIIVYPVPAGKSANRDKLTGSWFIQALVDVISENAHNTHLEDMLKMVDEKIMRMNNLITSNFQSISTKTVGWNKHLYFNPGLYRNSETNETIRLPDPWNNFGLDESEGMDVVDTIPQNSTQKPDDLNRSERSDDKKEVRGCFGFSYCSTS